MGASTQMQVAEASMRITTCTQSHELPDGAVTLLGAVDRVTPTMTLNSIRGVQTAALHHGDRDAQEAFRA